jgi:hypothetical protein
MLAKLRFLACDYALQGLGIAYLLWLILADIVLTPFERKKNP